MYRYPVSIHAWKEEIKWFSSTSWIGSNRRGANGVRVDNFPRTHDVRDSEDDGRNAMWNSTSNNLLVNEKRHGGANCCRNTHRQQIVIFLTGSLLRFSPLFSAVKLDVPHGLVYVVCHMTSELWEEGQVFPTTTTTITPEILTKKLAKCGFAKCAQHFETLILAKCGLATCGHENDLAKFGFFWPNAVLAKCGLAKCGHDLTRRQERSISTKRTGRRSDFYENELQKQIVENRSKRWKEILW